MDTREMQHSVTRKFFLNGFWISVLLHLLVLLCFLFAFKQQDEDLRRKAPDRQQIPSYIYKGAITPSSRPKADNSAQNSKRTQTKKAKPSPSQQSTYQPPQHIINKPKSVSITKNENPQPSLMASSLNMLRATQLQQISQISKAEEPIMLIGDTHEVADPFIQLIGRSLSANFRYPDLEGRMGIKGRVLVQMTLHPEGYFDEVQVVESSNNQNLDAAALYAVNKAPLVEGADMFIKKPKRFVVGFIFL